MQVVSGVLSSTFDLSDTRFASAILQIFTSSPALV